MGWGATCGRAGRREERRASCRWAGAGVFIGFKTLLLETKKRLLWFLGLLWFLAVVSRGWGFCVVSGSFVTGFR